MKKTYYITKQLIYAQDSGRKSLSLTRDGMIEFKGSVYLNTNGKIGQLIYENVEVSISEKTTSITY
jgi:hypothetical protein